MRFWLKLVKAYKAETGGTALVMDLYNVWQICTGDSAILRLRASV